LKLTCGGGGGGGGIEIESGGGNFEGLLIKKGN